MSFPTFDDFSIAQNIRLVSLDWLIKSYQCYVVFLATFRGSCLIHIGEGAVKQFTLFEVSHFTLSAQTISTFQFSHQSSIVDQEAMT